MQKSKTPEGKILTGIMQRHDAKRHDAKRYDAKRQNANRRNSNRHHATEESSFNGHSAMTTTPGKAKLASRKFAITSSQSGEMKTRYTKRP